VPLKKGDLEEEEKHDVSNASTQREYRSAIGCLLYLTAFTRPDIALTVSKLARYVSAPTERHWQLVKNAMRYLRSTVDMQLVYSGGGESGGLVGYADSSWGDQDAGRKSTSGFVFTYNGACISWNSSLQRIVARSTTEAEIIALSDAVLEAIWLRKFVNEITLDENNTIVLREDNDGCIHTFKNGALSRKTKHIEIRLEHVRDLLAKKIIQINYIPSGENLADLFTKPIDRVHFEYLRRNINLRM
jgi:hypothetical protein